MDASRLARLEDAFTISGLTARVGFRSSSSISFELGLRSQSGFTFSHVGWIDVHHPCDGHIKAQLRIKLPSQFHEPEQMESIIAKVFESLAIPPDETYETLCFFYERAMAIERATDREGGTDRIYSY